MSRAFLSSQLVRVWSEIQQLVPGFTILMKWRRNEPLCNLHGWWPSSSRSSKECTRACHAVAWAAHSKGVMFSFLFQTFSSLDASWCCTLSSSSLQGVLRSAPAACQHQRVLEAAPACSAPAFCQSSSWGRESPGSGTFLPSLSCVWHRLRSSHLWQPWSNQAAVPLSRRFGASVDSIQGYCSG